jgi:predicted peptidase
MNRTVSILLIIAVLFTLFGCAATDPTQSSTANQTESTATTVAVTTETTVSLPTETTAEPTTLPPETTVDPMLLGVPAGSYRDEFSTEEYSERLDYWTFVPENAKKGMPLVVFLHGLNEVGHIENLQNYGVIKKAREIYGEEFPFIGLNPCLQKNNWVKNNISKVLKALIDQIAEEYEVDMNKIILTGHSLGSIGAWYTLSQFGDYFSAVVPVSCGCDEVLNYDNMAKVPVWALVGDADDYEIRYRKGMERVIGNIRSKGGSVEFTIIPGMKHDEMLEVAYSKEVIEWMLSQ